MFKDKLIIIMAIGIFVFSPLSFAKKRCKPLLEKLQNIQAIQRSGYSAKQGDSLRKREDKARKKWWQCEKGVRKGSKKNSKKTNKANVIKSTKFKRFSKKKIKAGTPFKSNGAIIVKSKYQGEKKQEWLKYYQQPPKCHLPKNLSVFAFCSENKQKQRLSFEKQYSQKY